jgi:hypothetical protein
MTFSSEAASPLAVPAFLRSAMVEPMVWLMNSEPRGAMLSKNPTRKAATKAGGGCTRRARPLGRQASSSRSARDGDLHQLERLGLDGGGVLGLGHECAALDGLAKVEEVVGSLLGCSERGLAWRLRVWIQPADRAEKVKRAEIL